MNRNRSPLWLVLPDVLAAAAAFVLAYLFRFHSGLLEVEGEVPPFTPYAAMLPAVVVLWPLVFSRQGLYQLRRTRTLAQRFLSELSLCRLLSLSRTNLTS